jgi:hypothetical protein
MYSLTNVPKKSDDLEIKGIVDGENIRIVCAKRHADANDDWLGMADSYLGDHMLTKPAALRKMYADDLVTAIRLARDAGYAQAQHDIRLALGISRERI